MVRNRSGRVVSPDLERIGTAADAAPSRIAEDFQTSIVEGADTDAYSIASFSWFIVPAKFEDAGRKESMKKLPTWILGPGQNQAAALGYVAMPKPLPAREQRMLDAFQNASGCHAVPDHHDGQPDHDDAGSPGD